MRIAESVRALTPYTPGEQPKDRSVIKLNTNENPYLPSPLVEKVLASFDLDRLRRYPDPVFTELREKIAERDGTVPARVFVGNGSDEVLTLAAKGFTNHEIGEILGIGLNGVKFHLKAIYARLGVASRTEATSLALNMRMISA